MLSDGVGAGQEPLRSGGTSSCSVGGLLSENTCAENPQSQTFSLWGKMLKGMALKWKDSLLASEKTQHLIYLVICGVLKIKYWLYKEILSRYVFDSKSVGASFEVFLQSIHLLLSSVSTVHARPSTPPALITTSPSGFVSFTPVFFIPCKLLPMLTQNLL